MFKNIAAFFRRVMARNQGIQTKAITKIATDAITTSARAITEALARPVWPRR
jgi:hypothetical protein